MEDKINQKLKEIGGSLVSEFSEYKTSKTKLLWRCQNGHEFSSDWNHVQRGQWCPFCSGRRTTIDDVKKLAEDRGGKCLSTKYTNVLEPMLRECSRGHIWKACFNHINNSDSWCPYCNTSIGEKICRLVFEYAFDLPFPKTRPNWLLSDFGKRLELDGFCDELNIAFEYQGPHHYSKAYKYQDLEKIKEYDNIKVKECYNRGILLFIINDIKGNKFEYIKDEVSVQLSKNKIQFKSLDGLSIDYNSLYNDNSDVLNMVASEFDGYCLDNEYTGTKTKYRWRCSNNHEWQAELTSVKRGAWCSKCKAIGILSKEDVLIHLCRIKDAETNDVNRRVLQAAVKLIQAKYE